MQVGVYALWFASMLYANTRRLTSQGDRMLLKDIKTFVVGNPPPHFGGQWFVFVKLTTNDNVSGIGESYGVPFHPDLVAQLLQDMFGRYLEGQDPHDIDALWWCVYSGGFPQHP